MSVAAALFGVALAWYVPEILLARVLKWHVSWRMSLVFILRDLMLPVVYVDAWCTDHFVWRGNEMTVREEERAWGGDRNQSTIGGRLAGSIIRI